MSDKVYIAGPMRGLPGWNFSSFDKAEKTWREAGWQVMSPAQTYRAMGYPDPPVIGISYPTDREHLLHVIQVDLACIYTVKAVALLPGWENSVGCTVELAVAQFLYLDIYSALTMERIYPICKPWLPLNKGIPVRLLADDVDTPYGRLPGTGGESCI